MLFLFAFSRIRLSHEEVIRLVRVRLSALSHTGCEGLPGRSTVPEGVCLTKRGSVGGWGVGGSNHKHVDPKNTDNLVSTAEAIDPPHHIPPHSPPQSHKYDLINTQ